MKVRPLSRAPVGSPDTSRRIDPVAQEARLRRELDAVHADPRRAATVADEALAEPGRSERTEVLALWLRGRAQNEIGQVASACSTLARARARALETGEPSLAAQISVSEAACLMADGRTAEAFVRLAEAERDLHGADLGRLFSQRGLLELHRGDLHRALADFEVADPLLSASGDDAALARLLANRGATRSQLGDLADAKVDLERCREVAARAGLDMIRAATAHNLGYLYGKLGEIPEALRWYDRASDEYAEIGLPRRAEAVLELDRCATMATAGLTAEAIQSGRRAAEVARQAGDRITLGDALLQLATAETAAGSPQAATTADEAWEVMTDDDRLPLAALAKYVATRARSGRPGGTPDGVLDDALELAVLLDRHGWPTEADDIRLFAAERLLGRTTDEEQRAAELLRIVAEARRDPRWHRRVTGWYAEALRRRRTDPIGARRALLVGVRIADAHRASLAAADLRAHLSSHTSALVRLGCELAVERDDPDDVLAWIDRAHAPSMAMRPVRPPDDERLAALLGELRVAHDRDDPRHVGDLEARIRMASRTLDAAGAGRSQRTPGRLADAFETTSLVEYGTIDDELIAVTVTDRDTTVHRLGPAAAAESPTVHASAALRRMSRPTTSRVATDAARASLDDAADELDRVLIAPLGLPPGRAVVVVPDASHHSIPWAALPSLVGRPWALSPSASTWASARRRPGPSRSGVAMIAGPDLDGADDEVARLAGIWGDRSSVLTSSGSTVAATLEQLERVEIAHFAAHGVFRSDSPSFSAIHVADGHLTVYDLESIASPPPLVVLAACDLALMAVRGAGDVLGTAAALLHLGVGAVVAPTVTIADHAATPLMLDLHRLLYDGVDAATALMRVRRARLGDDDPAIVAAARSLTVISADPDVPRPR